MSSVRHGPNYYVESVKMDEKHFDQVLAAVSVSDPMRRPLPRRPGDWGLAALLAAYRLSFRRLIGLGSIVILNEASAAATATYVFPVRPQRLASYPSCHYGYRASDIFVPIGARFVAPTSGQVDFVSPNDEWDPAVDDPATRGGRSVAIVGDDGVRYYGSHLSRVAARVAPGMRVETGQRLGWTGQSGNARGTNPHLHFGISHPTTPDDWAVRRGEIDPYPYLEAWRVGIDRTPDLSDPGRGVCR